MSAWYGGKKRWYVPDFAGECPAELHVAVLCGDLNAIAHKLRGRDEVDGGGSNDHLYIVHTRTKATAPLDSASSVITETFINSPTLGSKEAPFKALTKPFLASRETGFILKLPPTKNLRDMAAGIVWYG